jgi:hypothetical protein
LFCKPFSPCTSRDIAFLCDIGHWRGPSLAVQLSPLYLPNAAVSTHLPVHRIPAIAKNLSSPCTCTTHLRAQHVESSHMRGASLSFQFALGGASSHRSALRLVSCRPTGCWSWRLAPKSSVSCARRRRAAGTNFLLVFSYRSSAYVVTTE